MDKISSFPTVFGSSNHFSDEAKPSLEPRRRKQIRVPCSVDRWWDSKPLLSVFSLPPLSPSHLLKMRILSETLLANKQIEVFAVMPPDLPLVLWNAVLRSISIFVEEKQTGVPSLLVSAGDHCFRSWHHPQTPGCSRPTPLPSSTINLR